MPGTVYLEMLIWLWGGGVILEQLMEPWAEMAILLGSPRSSRRGSARSGGWYHRLRWVSSEQWVVLWAEVGSAWSGGWYRGLKRGVSSERLKGITVG